MKEPGQLHPALLKILDLATAEAASNNHRWIQTDHILLAFLRPDAPGNAGDVLRSFGLSIEALRTGLISGLGDPFEENREGVALTAMFRLYFERAVLEAVLLFDEEVTSEHLLLALVASEENRRLEALNDAGMDWMSTRDRVIWFGLPDGVKRPLSRVAAPLEPSVERPDLALAANPEGRDPWRRKPWASCVLRRPDGSAVVEAGVLRQYFVDRDGYPVLTADHQPVHHLVDREGRYIRDDRGRATLVPVRMPEGSRLAPTIRT